MANERGKAVWELGDAPRLMINGWELVHGDAGMLMMEGIAVLKIQQRQ